MTYDEIEIEDMDWDESLQAFTYQCPCGDLFQITMVRFDSFRLATSGLARQHGGGKSTIILR
jgi:hypothetical protein